LHYNQKEKVPMVMVEVLNNSQRRRRWTAEQKKAMVLESEQPGMNISLVARKYEIHPNQLFRWRKLLHDGALVAMRTDEELVPVSEVRQLRKQIRELERLLGRKTLENEILKDAIEIAREKKLISRLPLLKKDGIP
jgi:transposase